MQEPQVVPRFFIPANQHASEAIHPTMGTFDDPAPCFAASLLLERLGFFSPCADVGGEAKLVQESPNLIIVVAFIQTQALRRLGCRVGPLNGDTLERSAHHLEIIPIRAVDGEPEGDALAIGEHAAFGPRFPAIGGVLAHLFPPQGGLWSSRRPSRATPSQCLARRHIPRGPVPTTPRRRRRLSTLESDDAPRCASTSPWRPGHPTGSRCA